MPLPFSILASGDDAIIKVIFGIIFFVIWAISAAVSSVAKKQQEARRRQMMGQPPPPVPQRVAAPPTANVFGGKMTRILNAPPPRQTAKSKPRPSKPQKVKPQLRRPVPAAPQPIAAAPVRSAMQAPPAPTTHLAGGSAGSTTVIGGARAAANPLMKLMNPKTLRTLIITNELLQPPVALRDQWPPLG